MYFVDRGKRAHLIVEKMWSVVVCWGTLQFVFGWFTLQREKKGIGKECVKNEHGVKMVAKCYSTIDVM